MEEKVNNCYICIEKLKDPIYPAGCTHGFCKKHLKVKKLLFYNFLQDFQKLECGICRLPFKLEYFGNEPNVIQIFNNNNQNRNRNDLNIRNNNINNVNNVNNINRNERRILYFENRRNPNLNIITINNNIYRNPYQYIIHRQIYNHNNINSNTHLNNRQIYNNNPNNIINYANTNRNILNNNQEDIPINSEEILCGLFLVAFQPNKLYCIIILLLNIFCCGLGTFLMGLNRRSHFYIFVGFVQCFGFFFFYGFQYSLSKRTIFGKEPTKFFFIYFKIITVLFYLSSVYIGFFRNFIFCNPRKINYNEKKEKGIISVFLNILISGLGTIVIGLVRIIRVQGKCANRFKVLLLGIIQLFGYIMFLLGITLINEKRANLAVAFLFLIGIASYCFSIFTAIKYYKKITNQKTKYYL